MKIFRTITAILLSLIIILSLCSCKIEMVDNSTTTTTSNQQEEVDIDNWQEYDIKEYEIEDGAFEISGELNLYKYEDLPEAQNVIPTLNEYFNIELKLDEEINYSNGYGNWGWDDGKQLVDESASVSMSSKTGKFTLNYKPASEILYAASKITSVDEDKWNDEITEFAEKFEGITGKLTLDGSVATADLYYPYISEDGEDSTELHLFGRKYYFISENSKQTVDVQDGASCYIECGNSDIKTRDVQYFVVTALNDGTIVTVDNNITKAEIVSDGTKRMIDESDMDDVLQFFGSPVKDDKMIVKRVYINSYSNYFGYPEIVPTVKIDYVFESDTDEGVRTTELSLDGFKD